MPRTWSTLGGSGEGLFADGLLEPVPVLLATAIGLGVEGDGLAVEVEGLAGEGLAEAPTWAAIAADLLLRFRMETSVAFMAEEIALI